jgi:asparagine synthase (glutamine-hydrolysing)
MFRYFAAVWSPRSKVHAAYAGVVFERLRDRDRDWTPQFNGSGVRVYCIADRYSSDDLIPLNGRGLLIGTLFRRNSIEGEIPRRVMSLSTGECESISQSAGKSLTQTHWGSYVGFLQENTGNVIRVLRGPLSALPCMYATHAGVMLFFSRIEDFVELGLLTPTINFASIRAQATGGDYLTADTAINEVRTLLPGTAMDFAAGAVEKRTLWSPALLAECEPVQSFDAAVSVLNSGARASVGAWASLHRSTLLTLSGGFDSSVVLGLTREMSADTRVVGINFYDRAAADERIYARTMASKYSIALVERQWDNTVDFRKFLDCAVTATPVLHFTAIDLEPTCLQAAHEQGATAILDGELGDDVFGRAMGPEVVADCLYRRGWGFRLLQCAADYAQFKRQSVRSAIALGYRYRAHQADQRFWSLYQYQRFFSGELLSNANRLVSDEVVADYERTLEKFIHPWFTDVQNVPPGWFQLIYGLITTTSTWMHSPFGGDREAMFLHPLVSQPLVEAYMRIPASYHIRGGLSGAVARAALGSFLTPEVHARGRSKGTPEMWLIDSFERNRRFLEEFLLEGILVKERVLDRKKVEATLSRNLTGPKIYVGMLITQLYIEAWLQKWRGRGLQAAA